MLSRCCFGGSSGFIKVSEYYLIIYASICACCAITIQGIALVSLVVLRVILIRRTRGRLLFAPFYDYDGGYEENEKHHDSLQFLKSFKSGWLGGGLHGLMYVFYLSDLVPNMNLPISYLNS